MPINAYTGLMGSGKSYEVVENVILPALLSGRRVVTNVANLQVDEISAYLVEHCGGELEKLGVVVQVQNEDIDKAGFFPVEVKEDETPLPSVVQPGDLVVIDECWRWWAAGLKISPAHMVFFRMHRHFVDPLTKSSCDMVLVVQDITDLDRKLKIVVENTYRMTRHKFAGASKRYRVDLYASYKTTRPPIRSFQRAYKKEIFALYQSYSQSGGTAGKEVPIDDRANIFKGPAMWVGGAAVLLVFVFSFIYMKRFFNPKPKEIEAVSASGQPVAGQPLAAVQHSSALEQAKPTLSSWRVLGTYKSRSNVYVVLTQNGMTRTLMNPKGFYIDVLRVNGLVDGELVANYTGAPPASVGSAFGLSK